MFEFENFNFSGFVTMVLGLGILAQWLAWRFKLPSILLLLAFGFGAGQLLGVNIDHFLPGASGESMLLSAVGICVAIILFEGGLTLKFSELKQSGAPVIRLCTIGVAVSFLITTAVGVYVFEWNWRIAAILGSILVVTGPTVIAPLIRHIKPSRKMASIVKWEGIVVDPIGAIMAVFVFQAALAGDVEAAKSAILYSLGVTLLVGIVLAFIIAKLIEILLRNHLIPDFLHSVFLLSVVCIAFVASNAIQKEAGLLTVTVMGIALANQKSVSVKHILEFKETLRTLIISILFIVLSGRVKSESLINALPVGLAFLAFLIILIRPASIFIANIFTKQTSFKERLFLAFLAPRGIVAAAVTAIFALELEHSASNPDSNLPIEVAFQAESMVPVVFIVIIGTVAFYGLLAAPLANKLKLASRNPRGVLFAGADSWARKIAFALKEDGHDVLMLDTNYSNVAAATMDGIPAKRANILSEYVEEELDFSGLGQLVACTHNDEVNSLAAHEFTHIFSSADVWQVAPRDDKSHHTTAVAAHMRGRILFPGRPNHKELANMSADGMIVKKTSLTEQFTYEDFLNINPDAIPLFIHSEDRGLRPAANDMKKPSLGSTIYFLTFPSENYNAGSEVDVSIPFDEQKEIYLP
ncbi:K(+)/H(+) antiporter NhaP2 [Rubritalea halochordaticola]|uniref:K(+)/H(+) antiporter NhaP2 n=1 Tax=Rubritalea halochordaticola TaxID=714537 RepID=A0ABP9V674_9BACT